MDKVLAAQKLAEGSETLMKFGAGKPLESRPSLAHCVYWHNYSRPASKGSHDDQLSIVRHLSILMSLAYFLERQLEISGPNV
jgi:hypothetical protein